MENSLKLKGLKSFLSGISKPVDLTEGTPWKVILKYALPIMFSYLLQQIYVLTDAIICGQVLTAGEVAGVNDTFPLTFIFLQLAFGCTAGFSVITAGCVGRGDAKGTRRSFAAQIYLSFAISVLLTILSIALLPWMLGIINVTPANREVYDAAYTYCLIVFIGIAAQMGYNFICSILRSIGDSVTPLVFLVISTALNVGLDLLFLVPLKMGPAGAAIATVLAQFISFIACMVYTFAKYEKLRISGDEWRVSLQSMKNHLIQGLPLGLQFSILAIGIIVMQGAVVRFDITESGIMLADTPAQNGYGAANKLINFLMAFFNGLGAAVLGYNAQNYGKGEYDRIKRGTLQSLVMMLIISFMCLGAALLMARNGWYQYIFMSADKVNDATIMYGNTFLYIDMITYPLLGFLLVTRSGVQGVCKPAYVLGAGIAELAARILICTFVPSLVNGAPIDANASHLAYASVCAADPGAWIAACIVLLIPTINIIIRKRH